ncbi:MAG: NAD(P)/FAD-dependent oxidoreductase [bacterium]
MKKEYDVVIAGAGVAGCVLARDLARLGHSVAVLEKSKREDMGHDWWDTVELRVFEEVDVPPPPPEEIMGSFNFLLFSPLSCADIMANQPPTHLNLDRKSLAKRLIAVAESAGAEFHFETSVREPIMKDGAVAGVRWERSGESGEALAKITADASGMNAVLREKMPETHGFSKSLKKNETILGYREIREDLTDGKGRSILTLGKYDGVQWVSRDTPGLVDINVCILASCPDGDPRKILKEVIEQEGGIGDKIVRGGKAARIPLRNAFDSFVAPGLALVGDCASMPNPLNGSGISSSMRAAHFAAKAIHSAISANRNDVAALWQYNVDYKAAQDSKFVRMYVIQKYIFAEDRFYLDRIMKSGAFDIDWDMENKLGPKDNLKKLPGFIKLLRYPKFFLRLLKTLYLSEIVGRHFNKYPKEYDQQAFEKWSAKLESLILRIPLNKG